MVTSGNRPRRAPVVSRLLWPSASAAASGRRSGLGFGVVSALALRSLFCFLNSHNPSPILSLSPRRVL
ncbi:hypothetical protein SLA2020_444710 [Shorea laevis]